MLGNPLPFLWETGRPPGIYRWASAGFGNPRFVSLSPDGHVPDMIPQAGGVVQPRGPPFDEAAPRLGRGPRKVTEERLRAESRTTPVGHEQAEVAAVDDPVAVQVGGGIARAPEGEEDAEVGPVDEAVAVQVAGNGVVVLDPEDPEVVDSALDDRAVALVADELQADLEVGVITEVTDLDLRAGALGHGLEQRPRGAAVVGDRDDHLVEPGGRAREVVEPLLVADDGPSVVWRRAGASPGS